MKSDEEEFLRVLEGRAKDGGKLKIVDVGKNEKEVEVKELKARIIILKFVPILQLLLRCLQGRIIL